MIPFYILISIFIAWIWVDYFRLIDIYQSNKLGYLILTFVLGGLSVYFVDLVAYFTPSSYRLNGEILHDFIYSVFKIGAVEEFAKMIPFVLMYIFFRSEFKEPIDYLVFMSVSALGFSAFENVMYFDRHGAQIIDGRAILCSVGHMFDTALIAYGFIYCKYKLKKMNIGILLLFFFFAALSHGIYDFWLINDVVNDFGWIITILYFFVTVSFYAVIFNNALNISPFFTYKKVIDSNKIAVRLLQYYGIVYIAQFILVSIETTIEKAVFNSTFGILISGFIMVVTVVRLSRFKLIKGRWDKLKFELPFKLINVEIPSMLGSSFQNRVVIKGETSKESLMHKFYNEYIELAPSNAKSSYINKIRIAYVEDKVFLKNDEGYFVVKVFLGRLHGKYEYLLLKAKPMPPYHSKKGYPLAGLFKINGIDDYTTKALDESTLRLVEWAVVRLKS